MERELEFLVGFLFGLLGCCRTDWDGWVKKGKSGQGLEEEEVLGALQVVR